MSISYFGATIGLKFIRGVVALWFQDKEILNLAGDIGVDFLEQKTRDFFAARKTARLLEEIADTVTRDLNDFIKSEHKSLKKGDIKLIIDASLNILATDQFFEYCMSERMDQTRILRGSVERWHSACETLAVNQDDFASIFRFVVLEFLAVLHSLPRFDRTAFRLILADSELILEKLTQIQAQITDFEHSIAPEITSCESEYRRIFSRQYKEISLFGLDSRTLPRRYDLSVAYIHLTVNSDDFDDSMPFEELLSRKKISDSNFVTIVGAAGSGKTTLLSWLALQCASRSLPPGLAHYNSFVPVMFKLREYQTTELPLGVDILDSQLGVSKGTIEQQWIIEKIQGGKILFLFDGYDEVSHKRGSEIVTWICDLGKAFPGAKFFVSTRPYASDDLSARLFASGFGPVQLNVEPMDIIQIEKFVDHWYDAYNLAAIDKEQLERLRAAKERLRESLVNNTNIRSISNNPLLCALICFVNADREGFVPSARGDLYSIATETLLDRREKERQILYDKEFSLSKNQKFKIMGFISEYFFLRRSGQLSALDIAKHLKDFLPALGIDKAAACDIVQYLAERSHVLRSPQAGFIDFSHKTFQEYFYARRIVDANLREMIVQEFFAKEMAEVVLFTCAVAPTDFVESVIVQALRSINKLEPDDLRNCLIFLYSCMTEAAELSPAVRQEIGSRLDSVLPPRCIEEAENIGSAGRSVVEPLSHFATTEHKAHWQYCASALISTFCEDAFPALARYAMLGCKEVDKVLMGGKRYFESKRYNKIVLEKCRTVGKLVVNNYFDYELLEALPSIRVVEFVDYDDECFVIEAKTTVVSVGFRNSRPTGIQSLSKMFPNVRILTIEDCPGFDCFDDIGNCTELRRLKIWSEELTKCTFVSTLKKLKNIDFSESINLEDVSRINDVEGIQNVWLPYAHLYDVLSPKIRMDAAELDADLYCVEEEEIQEMFEGGGDEDISNILPRDDDYPEELSFDDDR